MQGLAKVFNYVKVSCWEDDTQDEVVVAQAQKAFKDLTAQAEFTKFKLLYRLAGQSGSGKTTQLLPAVSECEKIKGRNPIIIGVRTFVQYHPQYSELLNTVPKSEMRERTNGFALKCLCVTLKLLIESGYFIVLDITILDPVFEEFVLENLNANGYKVQYHILAVSKTQSDAFICKRAGDVTNAESGRKVNKASMDYFYNILPVGLKYLAKTDRKNSCYIWSAYDRDPIYMGKLLTSVEAVIKGRETVGALQSEDELRAAKIKFISSLQTW